MKISRKQKGVRLTRFGCNIIEPVARNHRVGGVWVVLKRHVLEQKRMEGLT